jgi:hypothetical protein
VHESVKAYCAVGSVTSPLTRRYDLITCIEVLEHLPQAEAELAIASFCAHTDDVLFSSSPNDFTEPTHINVQPPAYWAGQFAQHGFFRDANTELLHITPWATRFRRMNVPVPHLVGQYEQRLWQTQQENHALRAEVEGLRQLVHGYESGRFIRMMSKLKRWAGRAT